MLKARSRDARTSAPRRRRRLPAFILVGALYVLASAHEGDGGCCGGGGEHHGSDAGDGGGSALPEKITTFTKMRGPNTGEREGGPVAGTCAAGEVGKASCYGLVLVHCPSTERPYAVDCSKKAGTTRCNEDDTTADCR